MRAEDAKDGEEDGGGQEKGGEEDEEGVSTRCHFEEHSGFRIVGRTRK